MGTKRCVECETPLRGRQRKFCSNACKQRNHYHRVKHQTNTYFSQTLRGLRRKLRLIKRKGGACSRCGYSANIAALQFHHRDASRKAFQLDLRSLSNRRWQIIAGEATKCDLLCANCHAEVHHPEMEWDAAHRVVHGASAEQSVDVQRVNSGDSSPSSPGDGASADEATRPAERD
jgi:hypothetical protein